MPAARFKIGGEKMFNKIKRITALLICVLMLVSYGASSLAYAEIVDDNKDIYGNWGLPVVQIDNGVVRVTADKQTGRFITETLSGLPGKSSDDYEDLLYGNRFESPETSYISVRIDGEDYIYGNNYGFLGLEGHYTTVPYADSQTNSIISEWAIKDIVITQRLSLINNSMLPGIGNVYVSYEIVNKGTAARSVGLRMLLDTKIGDVDSPSLTVPGGGFIYTEKEYVGDEIPSLWYAYEQYLNPQIIALGVVSGEGLSKPDKLQFAAWADVCLTKWDYMIDPSKAIISVTVNGEPYDKPNGVYPDEAVVDYAAKDSCAVMYWEPVLLNIGENKTIDTVYGVGDASVKDRDPGYRISLQGTDKLNMKSDNSGYTIDFVNAEFNIDNNFDTSKSIENLQIDLELPDELQLVEGQQKTVITTLAEGSYHRSMWKIKPAVQENFTISAYSILLRAEGMPAQRITKTLIMEGSKGGLPEITFLDFTPKVPFYVEDIFRNVFINGKGFNTFGGAIGYLIEAKLIQGSKSYTIDGSTFTKVSDTVFSVGIPDGIPLGTYDLFVSAADATGNAMDQKTFKNAVSILDDIKYSQNMVNEVELPLVMLPDGKNTAVEGETITIYGKFIDNKNGTYTSLGATSQNPVKINNVLKYAGGTLTINTNSQEAFMEAPDGILWCDVVDQRNKTAVQGIIATSGFRFEATDLTRENDPFVRMVYEPGGGDASYDTSYMNVPITIDFVILNKDGIDIKGSMGILNPMTYGVNPFIPLGNEILETMAEGYFEADVDNISITDGGMDIEGRFAFEMPFVMSLFVGCDAILEVNTKQEHIVLEVAVGIGDLIEDSAGAKARIGFRKGRFDTIYVGAEFPKPITVAPPIPIGITGFSGGLDNLSFMGAFPITIIVGIGIQDSFDIEFLGQSFLSAEGEITLSPFHLEGTVEAQMYMMDLAEVSMKFVWATWDPEIEKRGISIYAKLYYYIFAGSVYLQYYEGESFIGRGVLSVEVPSVVPVFGGLTLAEVMSEITQYSIAGSASLIGLGDIGIRYYFATGKAEFLELKEELENYNNGIIVEYDDYCIAQYGYNYIPMQYTQYADAALYITELNFTDNSNVMMILKMSKEQFESLDDDSIKLVKPESGGLVELEYINNTQLVDEEGKINQITLDENEMLAVKQVVDRSSSGLENEYMVTILMPSPENGQWTVITASSMEVMPYSSMKNPEIKEFAADYNESTRTITAEWKLNGEPDKFRFYIVNSEEAEGYTINNPASLWGTGSLLYGQTITYKDNTNPSTGETVQIEDQVIYTTPTPDGERGTFITDSLNLPTGTYYVYAKAEKENTVATYKVSEIEITNNATPSAPVNLVIKDIGNNRMSLSWDADYNMEEYYIYRKDSVDSYYDRGTPLFIYKVFDPEDYAPEYERWPANLQKGRIERFEVIIDGDEIDEINPQKKTYYFDVRAVGRNQTSAISLNAVLPGVTLGSPASASATLSAPEEIIVYTEIRSADSKIMQQPYVERVNGIELQYYKYVTNSKNAVIAGSSNSNVKYSIMQNNVLLTSINTDYSNTFSHNVTLNDGNNYFIITYENEGGDTIVEEFIVEYDNKAPILIITHPKEGAAAENGKITAEVVAEPYGIVSINNVNYDSDENGHFIAEIDFGTSYLSKLIFETRDAAGNVTTAELNILNDLAEIEDITLTPEYKIMHSDMTQQLSTYVSKDDILGEKLPNSGVKYSITKGSDLASVDKDGVLTAKYEGTIIVKAEFYLTDKYAVSDSIGIEIIGDKKPGSSKYIPPVYSREMLIWLAGGHMSTLGGTIKTDDGVILYIPNGALPYYQDNIDIFAFKNPDIDIMRIPTTAFAVSQPYFISLVTEFTKPAMLTLPVSGADSAFIYRYDEETGTLIYMGGQMSSDKKSVTAGILKPGTYIALNNPVQDIFADIAGNHWGYDYIYGLNFLGIINGYRENGMLKFKPDAHITRVEFIKLLVSTQNINLSEAEGIELKFADNDEIPAWAVPYVKAAVMKGLINGKNIGGKIYLAAEDNIVREEIAAIMGRTINTDKKGDKTFSDNDKISSWALEHVMVLAEAGIISGYEDNTFRPRNNASRAEAATMIYKYLVFLK